MADETKDVRERLHDETTRMGKFIQTYSGFLSSFVIGVAGLIATSIWQFRQSEIARRQAESQQKVAETTAANQWRIERAEILAKNLQVLAAHGPGTVEQRYGVLLSLTRGDILDPELAVSYALDLGKDDPEYMRSVLANTHDKDYERLASAFELTCEQRFGLTRDVPICKSDKEADRSAALAELISDDVEAAIAQGKLGPLVLVKDEREVQLSIARRVGLFAPYLVGHYERRQWADIARFEALSDGAHLISALILGKARPGEFVTNAEAEQIAKIHNGHSRWLCSYLFGATCNAECRGKVVDVILTGLSDAEGRYDEALRTLLRRPRAEVGPALARLHLRLLSCSLSSSDLAALRDRVLVPVLADEVRKPKPSLEVIDDASGLLALVPEPTDATALAAWQTALGTLEHSHAKEYQRAYFNRRVAAKNARTFPSPSLRNILFCNAAEGPTPPPPIPEK